MSSFMIWHKVVISRAGSPGAGGFIESMASAFGMGLPLTITNNVYSLGLILDATITVTLSEGTTAGQFSVQIVDLPDRDYDLLHASHASGTLVTTISLGYFDNPTQVLGDAPVLRGRITTISRDTDDQGHHITTVQGLEETAYFLTRRNASVALSGRRDLDAVVRRLIDDVNEDQGSDIRLANASSLGGSVRDYTIVGGTALSALTQLAELADKPIIVGDGTVALGPAVGTRPAPIGLDAAENIVKLGASSAERAPNRPPTTGPVNLTGGERQVNDWHELTILGHPGLRAGQLITVTGVEPAPAAAVRISRVIHRYSTTSGYICDVALTDVGSGVRARPEVGVAAVVDRWNRSIIAAREEHPTVDIGEATEYRSGSAGGEAPVHRVSMNYRQVPQSSVAAPSTDSPVGTTDRLLGKPIASAFAFDKVGLMTPVYPGMRAVLLHNRSSANDAVVAGWIWPTEPESTPPPNEAGDYWLALPTELSAAGKPTGKGVHDLIDARGRRVVHARALHLLVGGDALGNVGTRPTVPDDDTVVIEHSSGTTITVSANGELTISAAGALEITTEGRPIKIGNGSVSVELDGPQMKVS